MQNLADQTCNPGCYSAWPRYRTCPSENLAWRLPGLVITNLIQEFYQCSTSWSQEHHQWHHFMLWHQWLGDFFASPKMTCETRRFSNKLNFCHSVDNSYLLVWVDTFPTPRSKHWLVKPLISALWYYIGQDGQELRTKKANKKGLFR